MSRIARASRVADDSVARALLPIAAPVLAILIIGGFNPLIAMAIGALVLAAAAITFLYLLFRLIRQFKLDNTGPSGFFGEWRPGLIDGARLASVVLVRWVPFGVLSVLLFGLNGLVVDALDWLLRYAVSAAQTGVDIGGDKLDRISERLQGPIGWFVPDSLENLLASGRAELLSFRDFLANLLRVIRFLLVVEGYLSCACLIWLTVRSVLYFLARAVMDEQPRDAQGVPTIHVWFDMESL